MKTRIDAALAEFVEAAVENNGVGQKDLQRLLDRTREQFGLDVVYILDRVGADNLFAYKCVSFSRPEYGCEGVHFRIPDKEYEAALHMYDDGPVCDYNTASLTEHEGIGNSLIHYGFVRKKIHSYDGSVGFQLFAPHVWSDEERDALRKMGNILKAIFSVAYAEGINERLFQRLKQEQAQYRDVLAKGALCSIPFDVTEGVIRERIVTAHGVDIVSEIGLHLPVRYDVMNEAYLEKNEVKFLNNSMRDCLTCSGLLLRFQEGIISPEWEYYQPAMGLYVRVTVYMYLDQSNGHVCGLLAAVDVSEARRWEDKQQQALQAAYDAANQANRAKTRFLSNMSHDIRTPMNGIIGMTAIAAAHLDDRRRVEDCLAKITVASKHLLGLINEVLDMSKIESGKMDLQDEAFSLSDLIEHLLSLSKSQMEAKGHRFLISINRIEHEKVIGDSQRLQQAFMNLLSNAVKYTPDGGTIRLSISEKPLDKPNIACYEFIFEDNGIGMSEEFAKRLFEPFSRAEDERVGQIQGTGLGMTITKNIIQMMNGDIQVESRLNEGTKFTVTIFLKLQNETVSYEKFVELPVLVVDDEETACEYTCMVLEELGMKSEYVLSGQEAVDRVVARNGTDDNYFAVILDWKMAGMDGVETARQIRSHVGEEIPIIILSSYDWADIEVEARRAGVNAFISKPLFKSRLVHLFHGLLKPEGTEEAAAPALEQFRRHDFSGRRALLVEDNELNAEIAGEILGAAGLAIEYAQDGRKALDMVSAAGEQYYDIIFMDIQMPVMNGYDAARAIRALPGPDAKRIPIIAMTANAFSEDAIMAKNAGMNEHIAKPIDLEQLLGTLNHWLK